MSDFSSNADQALTEVMGMVQAIGTAAQTEVFGLTAYEYKMVPVDELTAHGADRWRVVAVPPCQEVKVTLGQAAPGPLTFLMERQVIVDDHPGGM